MQATTTSAPRLSAAALERLERLAGSPSDARFAQRVGISRATLYRLRAGDPPSASVAARIAGAFALEPGEILERAA